jgi:ferredoxin
VSAESKYLLLHEQAGWSEEGAAATPKIAALLAAAGLPEADPVPSVSYHSEGKLLIVGDAGPALDWAAELADTLDVSVLITGGGGAELPVDRRFAVMSGRVTRIEGYLGNFSVAWEQVNPIDFERKERTRSDRFDLILNLSDQILFEMPQPPQGYFAPGSDLAAQAGTIEEVVTAVGEFEKPRYFQYDAKICAHSRSKLKGCNQCIDICSTQAISADGDRVKVNPHLCMGCGACASVCPSGAMSYAYPKMSFQGEKLRVMLGAYREAGGKDACLLFHNGTDGRELILKLGRRRGLPAWVIPVETFHVASLGLDLLLGAVALGAGQVLVVSAGSEAPAYFEALRRQMGFGEEILRAFGYRGSHFELVVTADLHTLEQRVWSLDAAQSPARPAEFRLFDDKRTSLAFIIEHLATHAPIPQTAIPLSAGAPFGEIEVNLDTCTLCMACVGACPEAALADGRDRPQLRFVETNCVQCGLCEQACPEDAITLVPRLLVGKEAKAERVLNQDQPFHCIRCGKEFGTQRMLQSMLGKIAGHSMFSAPGALERMKMCGDCRVVDMIEKGGEVSVFDLKP